MIFKRTRHLLTWIRTGIAVGTPTRLTDLLDNGGLIHVWMQNLRRDGTAYTADCRRGLVVGEA